MRFLFLLSFLILGATANGQLGIQFQYLNKADTLIIKKRGIEPNAWNLVIESFGKEDQYPFSLKTHFVLEGDTFYEFSTVPGPGKHLLHQYFLDSREQLTLFSNLHDRRKGEIYLDSATVYFEKDDRVKSPKAVAYHEFPGDLWRSLSEVNLDFNHDFKGSQYLILGLTEDFTQSKLVLELSLNGVNLEGEETGLLEIKVQGDILELKRRIIRVEIPGLENLKSGSYQLKILPVTEKIGVHGVDFISISK